MGVAFPPSGCRARAWPAPLLDMQFCSWTGSHVIYGNTGIRACILGGGRESIVSLSKLHNVNNIILGLANSSFTDSLKTRKVPKGRTLSFLPSYPILLLPEATACLLKQPERTLAVQLLSVNGEKGNLNEFKYTEVFSVSKPFTQKSFTRGGNIWLTHIAHVPSGG